MALSLCHLSAKNYQNRWKFDEVVMKQFCPVFLRHGVFQVRYTWSASLQYCYHSVAKQRGLSVNHTSQYNTQLVTYRYFQMVNSSRWASGKMWNCGCSHVQNVDYFCGFFVANSWV